ncbi:MAG TPA: CopG family transcriptional regulator [Xanthomonadales bacterium]|nr:CopG family transcriptional regulator [Xanthomonadales bacterium]
MAAEKSAPKGVRKVTVNLPEEQVQFLMKTAQENHLTVTEVLRRAINSERFFVEQEQSGRKILIESEDKRLREVVRR